MKILEYPEKEPSAGGKDTSSASSNHSKQTKSKQAKSRIKREFDVHLNLRDNDAIVKPMATYKWPEIKPKVAILVMEYCPHKDLESYLRKNEIVFNDSLARTVTLQVVSGLKALKIAGYFHRDIKANNIFVTGGEGKNVNYKLGDLGLVAKIDDENRDICGTPSAMAPEMNGKHCYNMQVDMWSLGILLYTKKFNEQPFIFNQNDRHRDRIEAQRKQSLQPR